MHRYALSAAVLAVSVTLAPAQEEADPARGAGLAEACAACHGAAGVSVAPDIPNLAAQKEAYLIGQLAAFRGGTRSSAFMNPVAAGLSDQEIADLAAHFSALPGAEPGASGAGVAALDGTRMPFPTDYESRLVRYYVQNRPDQKQVRHYWADPGSVEAAKAGEDLPGDAIVFVEVFDARLDADGTPVTGEDGTFEAAERALYIAMQKIASAGDQVPEIYANGDWRYALFETDESHRESNEAKCLACHKSEAEADYVFTYEQLAAAE